MGDKKTVLSLHPYDEEPHPAQLEELHEPHEEPCELVKPLSLLWLKVERSFLTLVLLQVGQQTS
jgi:hypothetical protein